MNAQSSNTIRAVLAQAKVKLQAVTDQVALEADILLAHVLQKSRSYLLIEPEYKLAAQQMAQFNHYIERRSQGEPVAYIIGKKEFWSLPLKVTPATLIPRPETELLVEHALTLFDRAATVKVADLGTGSGAIALALGKECKAWKIVATDQSVAALQVASENAHNLGIKNISFYQGSWCTALPHAEFDMILSNPPYIGLTEWQAFADGLAFEPETALVSGQDGLDAIRVITHDARTYLKPGGYLLIEHGFTQGSLVRDIFVQHKYENVRTLRDLAGQERVTIGLVAGKRFFLV